MKQVNLFELKDLSREHALVAWKRELNNLIDFSIDMLSNDLRDGIIDESQYYEELGCDKHYAGTTAWFIPSCYYSKHSKVIHRMVKENLSTMLFIKQGTFVMSY